MYSLPHAIVVPSLSKLVVLVESEIAAEPIMVVPEVKSRSHGNLDAYPTTEGIESRRIRLMAEIDAILLTKANVSVKTRPVRTRITRPDERNNMVQ